MLWSECIHSIEMHTDRVPEFCSDPFSLHVDGSTHANLSSWIVRLVGYPTQCTDPPGIQWPENCETRFLRPTAADKGHNAMVVCTCTLTPLEDGCETHPPGPDPCAWHCCICVCGHSWGWRNTFPLLDRRTRPTQQPSQLGMSTSTGHHRRFRSSLALVATKANMHGSDVRRSQWHATASHTR